MVYLLISLMDYAPPPPPGEVRNVLHAGGRYVYPISDKRGTFVPRLLRGV